MIRNLECFRWLYDVIIKKVSFWVSVFDINENLRFETQWLRRLKVFAGAKCNPEYSRGGLLCLWEPLFFVDVQLFHVK